LNYISYFIETKASPELAWDIFSDLTLWPQFSDQFGQLQWIAGEPWQKGSRLRIEILHPVHIHVDHLITVCVPAKRLGWIDRAIGTTLEQWAYFEPLNGGGTRVHTWGEFTGIARLVAGQPILKVIRHFTEHWYDNYRQECDRRATQMAQMA